VRVRSGMQPDQRRPATIPAGNDVAPVYDEVKHVDLPNAPPGG
jgi:hypothetical protein